MSLIKRWIAAFGKFFRTVDRIPDKQQTAGNLRHSVTASRAREMLERIRRGEYEFSSAEVSEILQKNNWLGRRQSWFKSLSAIGDSLVEVHLQVPVFDKIAIVFQIMDLWHDQRVSSIDFQIRSFIVKKWRNPHVRRFAESIMITLAYAAIRWNGSWRFESLRFVLRVKRTIRLYFEWPEKKSALLGNISVIGLKVQKNSLLFYTFRRSADPQNGFGIDLPGGSGEKHSSTWGKVAVLFSWILLGAYAFVLVHVTLPVLGGAFRLMPQGATAFHIWVLTQTYNLCVILLSYFFLRITMLPFYLKWNKSREDLATLISLEERDHQYLRPLTELVKKMQQAGHANVVRSSGHSSAGVDQTTIAQMIELMSMIREQSRQRLLGMTRMRRGWIQDLMIGYLFIFSLEWMYYRGLLTPLSVSIKWVNRIMEGLFLTD